MGSFIDLIHRFGQLFIWWIIISPWEQAIRVRLGRHITVLGPGIHLKLPVIDVICKQTVRLRILTLARQTLSTTDQKTITLIATVGYSITDVKLLYTTLHHAEGTMVNIVSAKIAECVHGMASADCTPLRVEATVNQQLVGSLAPFGVSDPTVRLVDFASVKTFRLLNDQRWADGDSLDTRQ